MINIKKVVARLSQKDYESIAAGLLDNKAEKFHTLLTFLREDNRQDPAIRKELGISQSAFYTLKSRLYEKIQDYLLNKLEGPRTELMRKVASIPTLLYDTDRDTAKAVLKKLEKDLVDNDMPYDLIPVYDALKKLHLHTQKYYEYSQAYNRHVAYTLALDKVEELLTDFNRNLGAWFLSRDPGLLDILRLAKAEINNVAKLYESHHLYMYKGMVNIAFALYVPHTDAEITEDEPIEDILVKMEEIINTYPGDIQYQYLRMMHGFYSFEYYHRHKIYKKADQHQEAICEKLPSLLLYNATCPPTAFLASRLESYRRAGKTSRFFPETMELLENYKTDREDTFNFVNFTRIMAAGAFYASRYQQAIDLLNSALNEVSLRNTPHAEIELKLFLAMLYSMTNEYNLAENLIRSVTRKVQETDWTAYENVKTLVKIIQAPMRSRHNDEEEKLLKLRDRFLLLNQGTDALLECLAWDDQMVLTLAKPIKETVV